MRWIKRVFWNDDEDRLRAGWRLVVQVALNLVLALASLGLVSARAGPAFSESPWSAAVGAALFLGATLLAVWLAGRFLDRRAFADFGLHLGQRAWWADAGAGVTVGFIVPAGAMLLASLAGWAEIKLASASAVFSLPFLGATLLSAVTYICVGLFEEVGRAYHLRNLLEGTFAKLGPVGSSVVAIAGAALISVMMHRGGALFLFYVFVSASVLGLFFLLTGRMAIAAGAHFAYDFAMLAIFGFGAEETNEAISLFRVQQDALMLPTAEGFDLTPLGLVLVLGVEILMMLLLLGWVYLRDGRLRLQEKLTAPTLRMRQRK